MFFGNTHINTWPFTVQAKHLQQLPGFERQSAPAPDRARPKKHETGNVWKRSAYRHVNRKHSRNWLLISSLNKSMEISKKNHRIGIKITKPPTNWEVTSHLMFISPSWPCSKWRSNSSFHSHDAVKNYPAKKNRLVRGNHYPTEKHVSWSEVGWSHHSPDLTIRHPPHASRLVWCRHLEIPDLSWSSSKATAGKKGNDDVTREKKKHIPLHSIWYHRISYHSMSYHIIPYHTIHPSA